MNTYRSMFGIIACSCLIALSGCGASDLAQVEGTITLDSKPLANASVLFTGTQGSPSGARTNDKGIYRLMYSDRESGAIPGKYTVRISTMVAATIDEQGKPVPGKKETVPSKYNARSTLEFSVEPGKKNVADFSLDSKGPIEQSAE